MCLKCPATDWSSPCTFLLLLSITVLSSPKQWQGETQEFCPNAKVVLVGCKLDMRTDLATLRELSKQRLIPVTHEQVGTLDPPIFPSLPSAPLIL